MLFGDAAQSGRNLRWVSVRRCRRAGCVLVRMAHLLLPSRNKKLPRGGLFISRRKWCQQDFAYEDQNIYW
jgi:hypothetical protein